MKIINMLFESGLIYFASGLMSNKIAKCFNVNTVSIPFVTVLLTVFIVLRILEDIIL